MYVTYVDIGVRVQLQFYKINFMLSPPIVIF